MHTPTRPRLLSQLRSESVGHEAIIIGDPDSEDGLASELRRTVGSKVKCEPKLKPPASVAEVIKAVNGFTELSGAEIRQESKLIPFPDLVLSQSII
jgi:hypothetical protein